jgi:hypothetical protein
MAGMDFEVAKIMDRCYTQLSVSKIACHFAAKRGDWLITLLNIG